MTDLPAPPDLDPATLAGTEFSRGRKGYEPTEVRTALGRAADALRAWSERDERTAERIRDLEARLAAAEQLDEAHITAVLGEETARIVAAARSAAAEIRSKAEGDAERLVRESREAAEAMASALTAEAQSARDEAVRVRDEALEEASRERERAATDAAAVRSSADEASTALREEAESEATRLRNDAEAEATRVRGDAEAEAARLLEDATTRHDELLARAEAALEERTSEADAVAAGIREAAEAELAAARDQAAALLEEARVAAQEEVERARAEGREMVAEARELRERMLRDLAERRKTARRQIEAARAGRERIAEALRAVGRTLDGELTQLADSELEARRAGDVAAGAVVDDVDLVVAELSEGLSRPAGGATGDAGEADDDAAAAELAAAGPAGPDGPDAADEDAGLEATAAADGEDDASATVHDLFERIRAERAAARSTGDEDLDDEDLQDDDLDDDDLHDDDLADHELDEGGGAAGPDEGPDGAATGRGGAARTGRPPRGRVGQSAEVITLDRGARTGVAVATAEVVEVDVRTDEAVTEDVAAAAVAEVAEEPAPQAAEADPLTAALDRRDELLGPVERSLARTLKRLASDEQNEVLDRLRRVKRGRVELDALLPDGDVDSYSAALAPELRTAAEAGRELWAEQTGQPVGASPGEEDLASALRPRVEELLGNRRAHLQRVLDDADAAGLEPAELADHLRAAYREWRSGSLPELAGDLATAGFARGTLAAAGPDASWCWVPDHGGLPCADAEDNALAGSVRCGEAFPTGDVVPPAHAGCRCILRPASDV